MWPGPGQPSLRQHASTSSGGAPPATSISPVGADIGRRSPPDARPSPTARRAAAARRQRAEPRQARAPAGRRACCRPARAPRRSPPRSGRANIAGASGSDSSSGQALRRGQQDVAAAPRAGGRGGWPACRRCASRCARPGPSRPPARIRLRAMSVGQRLQRADIERVQPVARRWRAGRPGWAGTRPASCRRRSARSAARSRPAAAAVQHRELVRAAASSRARRTRRRTPRAASRPASQPARSLGCRIT